MGPNRPSALLTMTHSDVFKPSAMSYTARLAYEGTDRNAILNVVKRDTGAAWMFNWIGKENRGAVRQWCVFQLWVFLWLGILMLCHTCCYYPR